MTAGRDCAYVLIVGNAEPQPLALINGDYQLLAGSSQRKARRRSEVNPYAILDQTPPKAASKVVAIGCKGSVNHGESREKCSRL